MAEHADSQEHAHAHPNYVKVWAILVGLLIVSILGPFVGIKVVTLITAFGIAVVKAYLVAKNFMHVNIEPRFVTYLLGTALGFMALLVFFVSPDVLRHEGQNWENLAAKDVVAAGAAGPEEPFDAAQTYAIVCANCHGPTGKGDGPAAASLKPKPADFSSPAFWAERDKEMIMKTIREGGAATGKSAAMAPYGGTYDDAKISALADYLMTLKVGDAPAPTPANDTAASAGETEGAAGETEGAAGETEGAAGETEGAAPEGAGETEGAAPEGAGETEGAAPEGAPAPAEGEGAPAPAEGE